ncbi:PAS domain S-box protein [Candidatus Bipolaricaulota bacterium]|nr:PAS domain S-box protein [Candidatus Bipolaricaulota bacterium]
MGILKVAWARLGMWKGLRESEARYRSVFESTSDAVLVFDHEGIIVEANPAACGIHGYPYGGLIGLSGKQIVHPDYHERFDDHVRRSGGQFRAQSVGLRRDGTPIHVEIQGFVLDYRGWPHLLVVVREITEGVKVGEFLERQVQTRTRELTTLLEVVRAASRSLELREVLKQVAHGLAGALGVGHCAIYLVDEDRELLIPMGGAAPGGLGLGDAAVFGGRPLDPTHHPFLQRILEERRPLAFHDAGAEPRTDKEAVGLLGLKSILGVPFVVGGRVVAVAMIATSVPPAFTEEQVKLAQDIADTLALAIENARLYGQVQEAATEEERARLARELHDSVIQSLYSMTLFAEAARRLAGTGDVRRAVEHLTELGEAARQALKDMRLLVYELRPAALEREGLVEALRQRLDTVERRAGVEASFSAKVERKLPHEIEDGLYRIAQEALNNALKHAHADSVAVRITLVERRVELEILDDGRGFDPAEEVGGLGLANMRERAQGLGGMLSVSSAPGGGTKVRAAVPLG